MNNWFIVNKKDNFEILSKNDRLSGIQKRILANRNITDENEIEMLLNPDLNLLHSPFKLKDMELAVDIVFEAMMNGEKIRIVGDYDQDGVAATVILYKGIGNFYDQISYSIPDRIEDGYGINKNIVDDCFRDNIGLIITCDNGIAAIDAIEYAKEKGIKVIVTDHHQVIMKDGLQVLPDADAVINPQRLDDTYPFKKICGAVVAYKLIAAMFETYGFELNLDARLLHSLLQYAALGTISDMMEIRNENRIIVIEGLKRINNTDNLGIKVLLNELSFNKEVDIYTVGFIIGPIINASGRIFTAKLGVELFLEDDIEVVTEYARELISLNNKRKLLTKEGFEDSINKINDEKLYLNDIIILYNKDIHESVCGLIAGRIKERYNKPVIVFTDAQSDGVEIVKGSGRSINAYNMYENLAKFRDFFVAFGGHKMACGLSLEKDKLFDFSKILNEESKLSQADFVKNIDIDFPLNFNQISFSLLDDIEKIGPFGYGYKEPIFASKNLEILQASLLGKNKNVLKFILGMNGVNMQAISFDIDMFYSFIKDKYGIDLYENAEKLSGKSIDIAYKLNKNTFNERSSIQLQIESVR